MTVRIGFVEFDAKRLKKACIGWAELDTITPRSSFQYGSGTGAGTAYVHKDKLYIELPKQDEREEEEIVATLLLKVIEHGLR